MSELARGFAQESVRFLRDTYLPRLRRALAVLPPADLWWRPHDDVLSVGVVLRHLEGNVRQWIVSGLGGRPDARDRASEFAGTERPSVEALMAALEAAVGEACGVIEGLGERGLSATYSIQGTSSSGLYAVYHVVEHFAWHTGQVVWIAKARAGRAHGLAFYYDAAINAARNG